MSTATHIGLEGGRTVRHCSVTYTEAGRVAEASNRPIRPAGGQCEDRKGPGWPQKGRSGGRPARDTLAVFQKRPSVRFADSHGSQSLGLVLAGSPSPGTPAVESFQRVRRGERICVLAGRLRCLRGPPCPPGDLRTCWTLAAWCFP